MDRDRLAGPHVPSVYARAHMLTLRVFDASPQPPQDAGGRLLHVSFEWSDVLWPWSGYLALYIRVRPEGAAFEGPASGTVQLAVVSPPGPGESAPRRWVCVR